MLNRTKFVFPEYHFDLFEDAKQGVSLALAIFGETTSAAIKHYYPNRLDAANFLNLLDEVFVICNSKQQFHTSNMLGNAAIADDDNKPSFLDFVANWVKKWSLCPVS